MILFLSLTLIPLASEQLIPYWCRRRARERSALGRTSVVGLQLAVLLLLGSQDFVLRLSLVLMWRGSLYCLPAQCPSHPELMLPLLTVFQSYPDCHLSQPLRFWILPSLRSLKWVHQATLRMDMGMDRGRATDCIIPIVSYPWVCHLAPSFFIHKYK